MVIRTLQKSKRWTLGDLYSIANARKNSRYSYIWNTYETATSAIQMKNITKSIKVPRDIRYASPKLFTNRLQINFLKRRELVVKSKFGTKIWKRITNKSLQTWCDGKTNAWTFARKFDMDEGNEKPKYTKTYEAGLRSKTEYRKKFTGHRGRSISI